MRRGHTPRQLTTNHTGDDQASTIARSYHRTTVPPYHRTTIPPYYHTAAILPSIHDSRRETNKIQPNKTRQAAAGTLPRRPPNHRQTTRLPHEHRFEGFVPLYNCGNHPERIKHATDMGATERLKSNGPNKPPNKQTKRVVTVDHPQTAPFNASLSSAIRT